MCYKCVEKREDLSNYQPKRYPDKHFGLIEKGDNFHDTGKFLVCTICGHKTFRGGLIEESGETKFILQCVVCGCIQVVSCSNWETWLL